MQQLRSSNPLLLLLKRLVNEQLSAGRCERPADALFAAVPRYGPPGSMHAIRTLVRTHNAIVVRLRGQSLDDVLGFHSSAACDDVDPLSLIGRLSGTGLVLSVHAFLSGAPHSGGLDGGPAGPRRRRPQ